MDDSATKPQVTTLLGNDVLTRVERLRLNPIRRLTNRRHGEHLTGRGGTSTEFSDYRDYAAGDDVRFVDWNIFARLNRPYLKLYEREEEMHVTLLVDASGSMLSEGKLDRAKQLAAALAVMGLLNLEQVSIHVSGLAGTAPALLPPCTGRASMRRVFEFLERIEGGGDVPIEEAIKAVLRRHRGRGIAVILSDFLTFGNYQRAFNSLFNAGMEIFAVQILGPTEIDPELTGDLRFVDCESEGTLDVSSVGELLGIYHEHRLALEEALASECRRRNGRFVSLSSKDSVEWILFDLFRRRGWVR